jgi:hypothetical protein
MHPLANNEHSEDMGERLVARAVSFSFRVEAAPILDLSAKRRRMRAPTRESIEAMRATGPDVA